MKGDNITNFKIRLIFKKIAITFLNILNISVPLKHKKDRHKDNTIS